MTGSGTLKVRAPRVNDRVNGDGHRQRFTSQILPSYMRRAPKVTEVLPNLYSARLVDGRLPGGALAVLLGEDATGPSPTTITRLTASWETEYHAWRGRDLHEADYVCVWVDGVHFRVRLEEDRLCTLVIGVRADGTKELIAVEDGYRESTESWATVLRDLKRRGLRAPVVAIGGSALGFWAAVGAVWPETRAQRCWVHRLTKGAGSRTKALMMAFKLLAMAEERWRKVNGSELLPLVRAGVRFVDGAQEKPKRAAGEAKESAA